MKIPSLILFFILIGTTAYAGWADGNRLNQSCTAIGRYDTGYCHGFISAAATMAIESTYCEKTVNGEKTYASVSREECENPLELAIPGNLQLSQVLDVVLSYLNNNPGELHKPAELLVEQALLKSFGLREPQKTIQVP
ncbi:MAG: Rap1a/Tai family immunity protein [Desulfobulbaceae bacterium]|nr:Rap1a/Tai family immunity protein [Desulfobulbaceae bacterium]